MKEFIFVFLVFALFSSALAAETSYLRVDFDESMGNDNLAQYNLIFRDQNAHEILDFYRENFKKQFPSNIKRSKTSKIPLIFHNIWIGDKTSGRFQANKGNISSCKHFHPNWQYILWDDEKIAEHKYDKHKLYELFEGNVIAQKEIVQYQILRDYGGVTLDLDFVCLQSMDELNHKYNFYSGLLPPSRSTFHATITGAVIASEPNNPIFEEALSLAESRYQEYDSNYNNSFRKLYRKVKNYFKVNKAPITKDINHIRVISDSLGDLYIKKHKEMGETIIFPSSYFSPYYPSQKSHYEVLDKIKLKMGIITEKATFSNRKPESIAVQYYNQPLSR